MRVCVPTSSEPNNSEGVTDVGGRQCDCAGGCGAGDCTAVGDGVAAYDISDDGDETLGVGDCGVEGDEAEGRYDGGGGAGRSGCAKWEPRSG